MNLASLQTITWSTVAAAVGSALLLASVSSEERPAAARHVARQPMHRTAQDNSAQAVAPQLAEAETIRGVILPETDAKP